MKETIEDFLLIVINEYPLDQLALLVTWMHEADDAIAYFTNWLDLGVRVDGMIREHDIDLDELLDYAMAEKRVGSQEVIDEQYERYIDRVGR